MCKKGSVFCGGGTVMVSHKWFFWIVYITSYVCILGNIYFVLGVEKTDEMPVFQIYGLGVVSAIAFIALTYYSYEDKHNNVTNKSTQCKRDTTEEVVNR